MLIGQIYNIFCHGKEKSGVCTGIKKATFAPDPEKNGKIPPSPIKSG